MVTGTCPTREGWTIRPMGEGMTRCPVLPLAERAGYFARMRRANFSPVVRSLELASEDQSRRSGGRRKRTVGSPVSATRSIASGTRRAALSQCRFALVIAGREHSTFLEIGSTCSGEPEI